MILILAVALPILTGALLPAFRFDKARRDLYMMGSALLASALTLVALFQDQPPITIIELNHLLDITLKLDDLGKIFAAIIALLWPVSLLYAIDYMKGHGKQTSFFSFFLMSYGVTLGIAMSGNLLTLYVFYEIMSLSTLPLVMHGGSAKSIRAGLKYLYYSLGGSAFAFIGLVYLVYYGGTTEFVPGGLFQGISLTHSAQLRLGYVLCFLGFSVKAAVFPVHGWLPEAAVAPTPVTALLHAVAVVKSGVFAILRVTYFSFGVILLRNSYAQYVPLALSAFTIVYGCTMALKEKHLKRRLAYSTISNLSYIVFGAMLLTANGLAAGLMHLVFHAVMKITLFLITGVFNERAHIYDVGEMRGIAQQLPLLAALFTLGSLAMTGLPPLIGFISKWYLAGAAVQVGGTLPVLGVAALLISALLTGIYLMVPAVTMYTRPSRLESWQPVETRFSVLLAGLTAIILVLSLHSAPLLNFLNNTARGAV